MNTIIKYPRAKPYFSDSDKEGILRDIAEILDTGMLTAGRHVAQFEKSFALRMGVNHAIAVSSCTSALEIAIRALGLRGKKIMVTTNTWMSCANVILLTDNIPVIVDIDADTLCMSRAAVVSQIDDIDAILWVHMAGLISPDFLSIVEMCKELGVHVIEDCAHAHGATTMTGQVAGSIGDVGCFSFYPTKLIATGEGGMITTNNSDIDRLSRIYRNHGTTRNDESDGLDHGVTCHFPSQNYRMTEIAGVIGLYQLHRLSSFIEARNRIAAEYRTKLRGIPEIKLLPKYLGHVYWNFYIILDASINRETFALILLNEFGIQTANAYDPAIHQQELFSKYIDVNTFPVATDILQRHISLPMYTTLTTEDIEYISQSVKYAAAAAKS